MTNKFTILYSIFAFMVIVRIFGMLSIPLTDTTEARYAHTALIMALSGDWITPYYDLGVAFWGKPPFSFWMEALSIKVFGVHDFSARFPAMIFTLFNMALIYTYLKRFHSKESALWGILIYFSFLLTYTLSGAILTDPYLAFATTLSMIAFVMLLKEQEKYWGYLFFLGLGIGMLAKGPLAIVIVGGGMFFWMLFDFKTRFMSLGKLPWLRGILLMLIISLPWYIMAELKTPGFLDYFIIGEHFKRFVDAGWSGDLYGVAHKKFHGMIWLMWIISSFPWVFLVFSALSKQVRQKENLLKKLKSDSIGSYFVMWSLFTMTFFTLSGNVLWTYILPALPSLAILLAIYLKKSSFKITIFSRHIHYGMLLFIPIVLFLANLYIIKNPDAINTDKALIGYYQSIKKEGEHIYYLYDRPFSAQYYSNDKAIFVHNKNKIKNRSTSMDNKKFLDQLTTLHSPAFLVIENNKTNYLKKLFGDKIVQKYKNRNRTMFEYNPN